VCDGKKTVSRTRSLERTRAGHVSCEIGRAGPPASLSSVVMSRRKLAILIAVPVVLVAGIIVVVVAAIGRATAPMHALRVYEPAPFATAAEELRRGTLLLIELRRGTLLLIGRSSGPLIRSDSPDLHIAFSRERAESPLVRNRRLKPPLHCIDRIIGW
jgi:hypothetical protein